MNENFEKRNAPERSLHKATENQEDKGDYYVEVATPAELERINTTFPPPEDDPQQHQKFKHPQFKQFKHPNNSNTPIQTIHNSNTPIQTPDV